MKDIRNEPAFKALVEDLKSLPQKRKEAIADMIQEQAKQEKPDTGFISPQEFADKTGFASGTIRKWLRQGIIKGKKMGPRVWLIPKEELEKALKVE